jgi:6-pyruvoyl-tetrahydropterin synthase
MILKHNIFVALLFVFLSVQGALAQNSFVVNVVEFEVTNKNHKSNQIIDSFQANVITNSDNFTKIFEKATKENLIKVIFKQSKVIANGETSIFASESKLNLINKKNVKIGEVTKFDFQITANILDDNSDNTAILSNLTFERNQIDNSTPFGDRFVAIDRRFYKTSIRNNFGQVTIFSGGKTPYGNSHFLAICFQK